jgi:hypothetical protein
MATEPLAAAGPAGGAYPLPGAADKKGIVQMALHGRFGAVEKEWGPGGPSAEVPILAQEIGRVVPVTYKQKDLKNDDVVTPT